MLLFHQVNEPSPVSMNREPVSSDDVSPSSLNLTVQFHVNDHITSIIIAAVQINFTNTFQNQTTSIKGFVVANMRNIKTEKVVSNWLSCRNIKKHSALQDDGPTLAFIKICLTICQKGICGSFSTVLHVDISVYDV